MFNLEQAITAWRQQLLAAGIKTPATLAELESHLREEIERQIKLGTDTQRAFGNAVKRIGQAGLLKSEFRNASAPTLERDTSLVVGIPTILVGLFLARVLFVQSRGLGELSADGFKLSGMFILAFVLAITLVALGATLVLQSQGINFLTANTELKRKYVQS